MLDPTDKTEWIAERTALIMEGSKVDHFTAQRQAEQNWYEYQESLRPQKSLF